MNGIIKRRKDRIYNKLKKKNKKQNKHIKNLKEIYFYYKTKPASQFQLNIIGNKSLNRRNIIRYRFREIIINNNTTRNAFLFFYFKSAKHNCLLYIYVVFFFCLVHN